MRVFILRSENLTGYFFLSFKPHQHWFLFYRSFTSRTTLDYERSVTRTLFMEENSDGERLNWCLRQKTFKKTENCQSIFHGWLPLRRWTDFCIRPIVGLGLYVLRTQKSEQNRRIVYLSDKIWRKKSFRNIFIKLL